MVESLQKTAWRACGELKIELSHSNLETLILGI